MESSGRQVTNVTSLSTSLTSLVVIQLLLLLLVLNLSAGLQDRVRHYYEEADDDDDDDDDDYVRPTFVNLPTNVTMAVGEKAVLKCRVENLGAKTVIWRRRGEIHPMTVGLFPFISDPRVTVEHNKRTGDWNLIVRDIRQSDDGVYQCQINAKQHQHNFYNIYLHVKTVHVHGTEYVERGHLIQLVCNATAGRHDQPYNIDWYKEDRLIKSDAQSGIIITKKISDGSKVVVSVLAIKRSKMTDSGEYFCRSSEEDVGKITVNVMNESAAEKITSERGRNSAASMTSRRCRGVTAAAFVVTSVLLTVTLARLQSNGCSVFINDITAAPVGLFKIRRHSHGDASVATAACSPDLRNYRYARVV